MIDPLFRPWWISTMVEWETCVQTEEACVNAIERMVATVAEEPEMMLNEALAVVQDELMR